MRRALFFAVGVCVLDQIVVVALRKFSPDLVVVSANRWFASIPGWVASLVALSFLVLVWKNLSALGKSFLLVGLLSNLLSYLLYGGVADYIPLVFWKGNLADLLLAFGVGWELYNQFRVIKSGHPDGDR